jgi:ribonuclease P protein component
VLPAGARLTRREDFTLVVRRGRRAGRGTLVVHYLPPPAALTGSAVGAAVGSRVGFVVSRAVGGSVDRHRVVRRLRHLVRERLDRLPSGARLVVRALPPARDADSATLGHDLDAALDRLLAEHEPARVPEADPASRGPRRGRRSAAGVVEASR